MMDYTTAFKNYESWEVVDCAFFTPRLLTE
jgi:hypothetical protein